MNERTDALLNRFLQGDRLALARILTHAENVTGEFPFLFDRIFPRAGKAMRLGVTGPPGAGKSTLVESMTWLLRQDGGTVGVVAVDPTSPFSGGALLGDRIRMQKVSLDPGVFVRSMASRGSVGGLARTTDELADIMDAFGFDSVIIETVGVGQSEVDVASSATTTLVVLFPGAGDTIQAMKAGLMEIADIFVVNKADMPGADNVVVEISDMLHLRSGDSGWSPPVLQCSSLNGDGIRELLDAVAEHNRFLEDSGALEEKRQSHVREKIRRMAGAMLEDHFWRKRGQEKVLDGIVEQERKVSPFRLAGKIVENVFGDAS